MEASPVSGNAKQGNGRKSVAPVKDLWAAVRNGTTTDVDAALVLLKKNNGNINAKNAFGSTALHIAVWRNHIPIVKRLLVAGADTDIRDGESGWSSLHRALHFGHLAVAGVLIDAGANLSVEDFKGRLPMDLISGPVKQVLGDSNNAGGMEVFSWGNGANYQLGTSTVGIQKLPCRLDCLQGLNVTAVAAAKFHSMALTADGKIYSWGFGRGGRLGHLDFDIHSGQVAVITPQLVSSGIATRKVKVIAVAKHHSMIATDNGEVFTWGSNREGQLGYTSVDTQPTPRRVTAIKARVMAVAAANKHSAVITDAGEVFTWGCNKEGQLGYGTSNSASNHIPHAVDYLKGKKFSAVSAAKYHTMVLGLEGEVFTWGYKMVMPRRVSISRNTRKAGNVSLKFHQAERLQIVCIAAGTTHSTAVSEDGLVFYWVSADPLLHCQQLMCMAGHHAVAVAAGKYRTAVVTSFGDIYAWDGEKVNLDTPPVPFRIQGIKHATQVSVGENHSLAIASVYIPKILVQSSVQVYSPVESLSKGLDDADEVFDFNEMIDFDRIEQGNLSSDSRRLPAEPPSLKELCENVFCQQIVEPKNALQLFEVADSLGATKLRKHCEDLVLHNLDYLLAISPMTFTHVSPTLLAEVEKSLDAASSQAWSYRLLPTPTALFPAVVDSEEDSYDDGAVSRMRSLYFFEPTKKGAEGIFHQESAVDKAMMKQVRALKKKLQQIEALELKQSRGHKLDHQQEAKLESKKTIVDAILAIETGTTISTSDILEASVEQELKEKMVENHKHHNIRKKKKKNPVKQSFPDESKNLQRNDKLNDGKSATATMDADSKTDSIPLKTFGNEVVADAALKKIGGRESFLLSDKNDLSKVEKSHAIGIEGQVKVRGFVAEPEKASLLTVAPQSANNSCKKKHRKGGLSMFLSGALDNVPSNVPLDTPVIPKTDGPAWGGLQRNKDLSSLREIQSQQTGEIHNIPAEDKILKVLKGKQQVGDSVKGFRNHAESQEINSSSHDAGTSRISLGQFIRSSPVTVASTKVTAGNTSSSPVASTKLTAGNASSSPTPWASSSPLAAASSFRDIQVEQVKCKTQKHVSIQGSPKLNSISGFNLTEKVTDEKVANCWYKPDTRSPSSIRCIQIEEEAIKQLQRIYKNAKVVRAEDSH